MVAASLSVRLSAETAQFHQRMTAAIAVFGKLTGASTSAHRGLFLVRSGVEQLAGAATGLGGPLGSVARGLLTIGAGGGVALVAAAAIGALTLAYKSLFGSLDKLVEKNAQLAKSLGGARSVADQLRAGITELGTTVQQTAVKTGTFLSALHGLGDLPLIQDLAALQIANKAEAAATALEQAALGVRQQRIGQIDKSIRQRQQENQQLAAMVELTAQLHVAEQGGVATRARQLALRQAIAEVTARYQAAEVGATAAQTANMVATARQHVLLEQNIKDRERQVAALRDLVAQQRLMAKAAAAGELGAAGQLTNATRRNITLRQRVVVSVEVDPEASIKIRRQTEAWIAEVERAQDLILNVTASLQNAIQDSIAQTAEVIGTIIAGAGHGFSRLGAVVLAGIGNLMVMLGKSLIAFGIAGLAIKKFVISPGLAIAAGAALIALGSALGAVANRMVNASPASGGTGGGFSPKESVITPQESAQPATIIIQGGLLDMSDPRQADAMANALSQLAGRRVVIQAG